MKAALGAWAVWVVLLGAMGTAAANPEPLPFSYVPETLSKGQLEVELYADFVPTKARSGATGAAADYAATEFQTELEYGLTPRLELGLYVTLAPTPGDAFVQTPTMPEGNGLKQRLKYHFTDAGSAVVDLAGYLEIVEKEQELEVEAKLIAGRRLGRFRPIVNLWAEREFYFDGRGEWVMNPTAGVTYEATYVVNPGLEGWMHVEFPDSGGKRVFAEGPHVYVGPTMMLSFAKLWWSTGFYFRVSDVTRTAEPGDAFGKFWLRTVMGVPL